jgi:hypothetical protein
MVGRLRPYALAQQWNAPRKKVLELCLHAVWSDNYGWINLSPSSTTYVANDGNGTLSGFAWGEQIGWIDFTGVTIDANGNFLGFASTTHQGKISFNCSNTASCANSDFKVATDWRPYSVRISSPSPASPLAGVSGSGGIYFIAPPPPTLHTPYWNSSSQKTQSGAR